MKHGQIQAQPTNPTRCTLPAGPDSDKLQAWNIPRQLDWQSSRFARDPAATHWKIFLCGTKLQTLQHLLSLFLRTLQIYDPSLPSVATPIPHPYALPPFTSTPHRSGNSPSHTSHMVFLHGPRPVSHVTPPGTLPSRPARPRGRPLRTRPGHQHSAERCPPPAVQLPHQKRVARCSQRMGPWRSRDSGPSGPTTPRPRTS